MNECSACHVDYYHKPDVRVFFSVVCDHRVCEPCVTRLFQRGGRTHPCPVCGQRVRAEDFSEKSREARQVECEVKVRRQICDIFCKAEDDFPGVEEYNDYLMQKEDIIYRLVNPTSQEEVQETWRFIDQYREQNAEQIHRARNLQPRKKFQKIKGIIEEEGAFCSSVNAEWGDRLTMVRHPFEERYKLLLEKPPPDLREEEDRIVAPVSPFAPQPLAGEHGTANAARQMSGGGQCPETSLKKARFFFFTDLVAATGAA